jgi:indolepyruvate ferredoxin oxidoreductase
MERQLIADYEKTIGEILGHLSAGNHALAVRIASIPEDIRGYGHVKEANVKKAKSREAELLAELRSPQKVRTAA